MYVSALPSAKSNQVKCPTTRKCVETVKIQTTLPASALKTESGKHVYLYLAIGVIRHRIAHLPKDYTLSKASHASKARRLKSGKAYVVTLTFIVPIRNPRTTVWVPNACTKDAETKDGLGLPGHHGCGDTHIARSAIYIG